jgi:hypothetical protein
MLSIFDTGLPMTVWARSFMLASVGLAVWQPLAPSNKALTIATLQRLECSFMVFLPWCCSDFQARRSRALHSGNVGEHRGLRVNITPGGGAVD